MDSRLPGVPPHYAPRLLGEQTGSRGQPSGQYAFLPGDAMGMQSSNLQPEHEFGIGAREMAMPPLGPPYLPQRVPPQYAPRDHRAMEQQLAELFSGQLDLLGSPLMGQMSSYQGVPSDEQFLGEGSAGPQEGEEKPRSKMQEKNRRVRIASAKLILLQGDA